MKANGFLQALGLRYPLIQAPMAGGATTPELVAAVSEAGALGSLGAGYMSGAEIKQAIQKIRQLTDRPFQVNVFVIKEQQVTDERMQSACNAINDCIPYVDLQVEPVTAAYAPSYDEQLLALFESKPAIVSFTFGVPDQSIIKKLQGQGSLVLGTATTLDEALILQDSGMDAIVVQGSEAGGHRGSFLKPAEDSLLPLDQLLKQVVSAVHLPVIAAGGIMNGRRISQVMTLGASAAQLGTAFLTCIETGISEAYKRVLLEQTKDNTVLTRAFSGALARGIQNHFTKCMSTKSEYILEYPIQNKLTKKMRAAAKSTDNTDFMSLWAGQSAASCRHVSAKELISQLAEEMRDDFR